MKKILITIMILAAMLVCMVLPAQASSEDSIFRFVLYSEETCYYISAAYVEDSKGNTYLITTDYAAKYEKQGYTCYVVSNDYWEEAELLTTSDGLAFFSADGIEDYTPLSLSSDLYVDAQILYQKTDDLELFELYGLAFDLSTLDQDDELFYFDPDIDFEEYHIGAPVVVEDTYDVMGFLTPAELDDETYMCMISLVDIDLPKAGIVNKASSGGSGSSGSSYDSDSDGVSPAVWIIIGVVIIGGAAVYVGSRKKKSSDTSSTEGMSGTYEGTLSLDVTPSQLQDNTSSFDQDLPPEPFPAAPEISSGYQIRGIAGTFEGQTFLLRDRLLLGRAANCDVLFPKETEGVSASHCELTFDDGHVILRDLQSTYGTFLGRGVKMESRVDYHLQEGDTFTMAEGTQAFRLERAGAYIQTLTPAVRSVTDGTVYRADPQGRIAFGRGQRCQVIFDENNSSISASHCILYRDENGLFLMDTGSTNGTFFREDQRLHPNQPYAVKKGMSFFLTAAKYTFIITEE